MPHRHRRRRRYPAYDTPSGNGSLLKVTFLTVLVLAGLYLLGSVFLKGIGWLSPGNVAAVTVQTEGDEGVTVSIDGGNLQRAENDLKLYPGDKILTGARSNASLVLFDGSRIRLDERTQVKVIDSRSGESAKVTLDLVEGAVWALTPKSMIYSGSIVRRVESLNLAFTLPSETEALLTTSSAAVFSSEGIGITVGIREENTEAVVGEGQYFSLQSAGNGSSTDPYRYRSALDPELLPSEFLVESREQGRAVLTVEPDVPVEPAPVLDDEVLLTVSEPVDRVLIEDASTVKVAGSVSTRVSKVRINGYTITLNGETTFSRDIALSDEEVTTILVEALSADSSVLEEVQRKVLRQLNPPEPPVITQPAAGGVIYQTRKERLEIQGTVSSDTVGVIVNDYRLQLFSPGDDLWTYLASVKLGNYQLGENTFTVKAINSAGLESEETVLTIILDPDGPEGILENPSDSSSTDVILPANRSLGGGGSGDEGREVRSDDANELTSNTNNPPILPGSLSITGPTPGPGHTATDTEVLIEGETSERTASVWVNNYRLSLYQPGKTFWNYKADTKLGTMQRGTNIYEVIARDSDGMILDRVEYTIELDGRLLR